MLEKKYSGVNDGKPYPVDMVAFKDGDSVSNLNVENGELKLNGETVGGGNSGLVRIDITEDDDGNLTASKTYAEIYDIILSGAVPYCTYYNTVFHLSMSEAVSEVSTMITVPEHIFCNLYAKGIANSTVSYLSVNQSNKVSYTEHTLTFAT